jgi:spore coat polysaccharide biosynthesis protein SpsF (cytidylyltransferase family)
MPKRVAVIPVRMGSTRLPGKALRIIDAYPVIGYLTRRISLSSLVDEIVVATSEKKEDDVISDYCESEKIRCFRGSEQDVLGRILGALDSRNADIGLVLFGDNPLVDPRIIDKVAWLFDQYQDYDFVGNDLETTYPPGMEVEVFAVDALRKANIEEQMPEIREHGTLHIRLNPERYKIINVEADSALNRPDLCLGLDTEEDLRLIREVVGKFHGVMNFSLGDIIEFLDKNPSLREINKNVERRWRKYRKDKNDIFETK